MGGGGARRLTGIVDRTAHVESPREVRSEEELHVGAVQDGLAGTRGVAGEDGIIETSAGVVRDHVEIVVLRLGSARGLQVEWLGGVEVLTGMQDRVGRDGGDQEGQAAEDVEAHGGQNVWSWIVVWTEYRWWSCSPTDIISRSRRRRNVG